MKTNTLKEGGGNPSAYTTERVRRLGKRYSSLARRGFTLAPEWDTPAKFVAWALQQPHDYHDWLIPNLYRVGNDVYGPTTCAFVPPDIGEWLNPYPATDELLLGVRLKRLNQHRPNQYITSSSLGRDQAVKATFYTQIQTHHKFLEFRLDIAAALLKQLSPESPAHYFYWQRVLRVRKALANREILTAL